MQFMTTLRNEPVWQNSVDANQGSGFIVHHTAPEHGLGAKKYAKKNSIFLCQGYVWTSQK